LFGTFDVVFVSLIDNYKFCQKVFDVDSPQAGSTTSYQIVTGICNNQFLPTDGIKSYFPRNNNTEQKLSAKKYVHITNFKVNNGLLIGNGNQFVDAVMKKMSEKLKDIDFIIFKSFSWSEIVLLQFGDDLEELQKNIISNDIKNSTIIHLRLGDVVAGNESHELIKRPLSIDELNNVVPSRLVTFTIFPASKFCIKFNTSIELGCGVTTLP
jgi:hypothetical protein